MAIKFKVIALALLLAFGLTEASAQSGCGGQAAAGRICGNAAGTTGLPGLVTGTALFDRTFGSTAGRLLHRGVGGWTANEGPTLGLAGGTGGSITLNGSTSGAATISVDAITGMTSFRLPVSNGSVNQVLITDGSGNTSWSTAGSGTVSSVGLSLPAIFSVSGSPVLAVGTLTATLANQLGNTVWAGPNGGAAAPTFRALVGADLPTPSPVSLGGVQSLAAVASQWIREIDTSGVPTASQPAFTDISGTLAAAQCPNPSASSIGCVQSLAPVTSRWINTISTLGVPTATQPAFSDISGTTSLAQLPSISTSSILGNNSGGTATPSALTISQVLDLAGSTQGQILYRNASAWVPLTPGTAGQVLATGGPAANPSWATVAGIGTVTSVATGTGLTGGPITASGTIEFATVANNSILANVSGGALAPSATTLSTVLDIAGSATGNVLYRGGGGWTALAPGTNGQVLTMGASTPAWGSAGTVSTVSTGGIVTGGPITTTGTLNINAAITPQGRLTLTSGVPVMTTSVSGATSVYYTPYVGNLVPLYDGTNFVPTAVAELTIPLGANWLTASAYDVFIASDGGTIRACTGPAWTSLVARGSGAGTTQITRTNGIYLNTVAITCRYTNAGTFAVAAGRGTYVGSFATGLTGQTNFILGSQAAGGGTASLMVWNAYNRVNVSTVVHDSTVSAVYTSSVTRPFLNSVGNRINFISGLAEEYASTSMVARMATAGSGYGIIGIGVDSATVSTTISLCGFNTAVGASCPLIHTVAPLLGYHFFQATEAGDSINATTFVGNGTQFQLTAQLRM